MAAQRLEGEMGGPSLWSLLLLSVATASVSTLPLFLTGAMAVHMSEELGFTAAGLGVAVAIYRIASAVSVSVLGRFVDTFGARRSAQLGVGIVATASFGIAWTARSWPLLVGWLIIGSMGRSLCQPALNRLIVNRVDVLRRGLAFGVKQAGGPSASMLAGFAVPTVALTLGWRSSFVIGGILAIAVGLSYGRLRAQARPVSSPSLQPLGGGPNPRGTLTILFVAFALASGASSVVSAFFVLSASEAGMSAGRAGVWLAVASVSAITVRVLSGYICDQLKRGHLILCTGMLTVGSAGIALLATGVPALMEPGIVISLAGTWGFDGVFWYAVLRALPGRPGRVTGTLEPGGLLGGASAPVLFGLLADEVSYGLSWMLACALSLAAALAMFLGARSVSRSETV